MLTQEFRLISFAILLWLIISGCSGPTQPPAPTRTPTPQAAGTPNGIPSPGTPPTLSTPTSPQVSLAAKVILIIPEAAPADLGRLVESEISRLAVNEGLRLEVQATLDTSELTPEAKVVFFLSSTGGMEETEASGNEANIILDMATSYRDIQFLAIGVPGLDAQDNLSVIDMKKTTPVYQGFLAGYLAAAVTDEWRVGAITTDDPDGLAFRQGFQNGVIFFCGLCQPTYPPFSGYPLVASLPQNSPPDEWQAAANAQIDRAVKSIFIAPGAGDASLVEFLSQSELHMIGTSSPPPGSEAHWIATINIDIATSLETIWSELFAGHGGLAVSPPLKLTDINGQVLTPGRQRLIEEFIQEIQGGFVDPGVNSQPSAP